MQFELLEYETGWSKRIYVAQNDTFVEDGTLVIEAHAPSLVRLRCLSDGRVEVRPGLQMGGDNRAESFIYHNGNDTTNLFDVKCGDEILLEFRVEDKNRCWNYWVIRDSCILTIKNGDVLTFKEHARLGDSISILVGLENYGYRNNINLVVAGPDVFRQMLDLFVFKHITYQTDNTGARNLDKTFGACSWHMPWLTRFYKQMCEEFGGIYDSNIRIPKLRHDYSTEKENVVLCQFDTRSANMLQHYEIDKILGIVAPHMHHAAVGGSDTDKYLGELFEYRLGDIEFIVSQLMRCQFFVGCDSGIGHLAGLIGVRSYIINAIELIVVRSFFSYYNTTVVPRCLVR